MIKNLIKNLTNISIIGLLYILIDLLIGGSLKFVLVLLLKNILFNINFSYLFFISLLFSFLLINYYFILFYDLSLFNDVIVVVSKSLYANSLLFLIINLFFNFINSIVGFIIYNIGFNFISLFSFDYFIYNDRHFIKFFNIIDTIDNCNCFIKYSNKFNLSYYEIKNIQYLINLLSNTLNKMKIESNDLVDIENHLFDLHEKLNKDLLEFNLLFRDCIIMTFIFGGNSLFFSIINYNLTNYFNSNNSDCLINSKDNINGNNVNIIDNLSVIPTGKNVTVNNNLNNNIFLFYKFSRISKGEIYLLYFPLPFNKNIIDFSIYYYIDTILIINVKLIDIIVVKDYITGLSVSKKITKFNIYSSIDTITIPSNYKKFTT